MQLSPLQTTYDCCSCIFEVCKSADKTYSPISATAGKVRHHSGKIDTTNEALGSFGGNFPKLRNC